ncbi:MAG: HEAT repeat domain-containing protein [Methanoregulaceae archaeon]|jgi:HEAT repeat protein
MQCFEEEEPTITDLIRLLARSDIDTRWRAATALVREGGAAVDPLLMKLFDDDQNVRVLAIWALGRIGDARAIGPISRSAEGDEGPVSMAAEGALSRMQK